MTGMRINTLSHTKEKPYMINSQFLAKFGTLEGKNGQKSEQNMCMYVYIYMYVCVCMCVCM